MAAETLTVKDVAEEIGTTGRLLRKFIRSEVVDAGGKIGEDTPGKGKRYAFTREEADELIERYEVAMASADDEEEDDEVEEELEDDEVDEDLIDDTSDPH